MPLPVSVILIVKNEEEFLSQALSSLSDQFEEVLIFDTGSTDATQDLIQKAGRNFRSMTWQDDFGLARREAAAQAKCDWIFFLDGDEVLDESAISQIQKITAGKDIAFRVTQRHYTEDASLQNAVPTKDHPLRKEFPKLFHFDSPMERLYKKSSGLQFEGRIHESLIPSAKRLGLQVKDSEILLHHYGRLKKNLSQKIDYYLKLTEKKLREEQNNPAAWIEMIRTLLEKSRAEDAFVLSEKALQLFPSEPLILEHVAQTALRTDRFPLAEFILKRMAEISQASVQHQADLTTALLYQKKFDEMRQHAESLLKRDPKNFIAHLNLGVLFFEKKDFENAKRHFENALQTRPDDVFVRHALQKALTEQTRRP